MGREWGADAFALQMITYIHGVNDFIQRGALITYRLWRIDNPSVTQGVTGLRQSKVDFAFGHRVDGRYVHAHLTPKKHY